LDLISSDVSEQRIVSVCGVTEFVSVSFSCCRSRWSWGRDYWGRGFKYRWERGCLFMVFLCVL